MSKLCEPSNFFNATLKQICGICTNITSFVSFFMFIKCYLYLKFSTWRGGNVHICFKLNWNESFLFRHKVSKAIKNKIASATFKFQNKILLYVQKFLWMEWENYAFHFVNSYSRSWKNFKEKLSLIIARYKWWQSFYPTFHS